MQRKRKVSRWLLVLLTTLALLLVAALGYWIWAIRCDQQFAKQVNEIRKRGEPVTYADIDKMYALPEGVIDATDIWERALRPLDQDGIFDAAAKPFPVIGWADYRLPFVGESWEQLDDIEKLINDYRPSLEGMHEAADKGGAARFDREFSGDIRTTTALERTLFEYVQPLRTGARLLCLDARVQAHRNNVKGVHRDLVTMFRLPNAMEYDPFLGAQMHRSLLTSIGLYTLSDALFDVEFSDEQLKDLQIEIRRIDVDTGYDRSVASERWWHLRMLSADPQQGGAAFARYVKQDTGTYFALYEEVINAFALPYPQAKSVLEDINLQKQSLSGPRHAFTKRVFPNLTGMAGCKAKVKSHLRMADLAIAITRYRLANDKKMPPDLPSLVPDFIAAVPLDPFNEAPITLVPGKSEGQFTLYCVGTDGKDDKGQLIDDEILSVGERLEGDDMTEAEYLEMKEEMENGSDGYSLESLVETLEEAILDSQNSQQQGDRTH